MIKSPCGHAAAPQARHAFRNEKTMEAASIAVPGAGASLRAQALDALMTPAWADKLAAVAAIDAGAPVGAQQDLAEPAGRPN